MNKCFIPLQSIDQRFHPCQNVKNIFFVFFKSTVLGIHISSTFGGKNLSSKKNGGYLGLAKGEVNCHSNIKLQKGNNHNRKLQLLFLY